MSFEPPAGILDIGNATLRVGKLEVAETSGLNQGLQNIVKNDLLITETTEYTTNQTWGLKLPTTWVGEFDIKGASSKYVEFNFYNEGSTSNAQGYTLNFEDTTLTLKYDNGSTLASATIPTIVGTYRKVNIFFERGVIAVSIDGTRYLYYKESSGFNNGLGVASRVVSTTGGSFLNAFFESDHGGNSGFKNLRIVNGRFISDKTSNVSFIGSLGVGVNAPKESLDIRGNMHLTRVSNVSQIKVDSNVVTEYTGPHDRPLRKYPEVAMTQNDESATSGYVVSRSSALGSYDAWKTFSAYTSDQNRWQSLTDTYDSSGNWVNGVGVTGVQFTDTASGEHSGEWIKMQLPKSIKLDYIRYLCNYTDFMTKDFVILGSNDDTSWTLLKSVTGGTSIEDVYHTLHINADGYYKYYVWLTTAINGTGGEVLFNDISFYGYEEGSGSLDTTLKTVYNVPATTGTQLEVYYDGQDYSADTDFDQANEVLDKSGNNLHGSQTGGVGFDSTYKAFTFDGSGDSISRVITNSQGAYVHSWSTWVKLDTLSGQILWHLGQDGTGGGSDTSSIYIQSDGRLDWFWWSNDVSFNNQKLITGTWYHLAGSYNGGAPISSRKLWINGIEQVISSTSGSQLNTALSLEANTTLRLGTRYAGGNFLDGSIANFRLYSKALNADQVKELYDYQKDYFLGSKSQVTLYKGHLGVGVTEPSGQLELAGDERIQEYPPGPISDYETLIPGHGVFCASASSYYNATQHLPWQAFTPAATSGVADGWNSGDNSFGTNLGYYAETSSGEATSAAALFEGTRGEWVQLKCPYPIIVKKFAITGRSNGVYGGSPEDQPGSGILYGSNDGNNWDVLVNFSGLTYGGASGGSGATGGTENVEVNATKGYIYLVLQATSRVTNYGTDDWINIGRLQYFGTPGPTTLDKGSLSLTRSLDVPRISRYDVDTETPRPEKLILDLDTTVNSSPTDISGRGNHGTFYNGAEYSEPDKAFNFSGWSNDTPAGTEDWIQATATGTSGNFIHSVSMWVKSRIPDTSTTSRSTFHMGNAGVANQEMQIQFNYTNNIVYLGTQDGWLTMSNMEDIIKQNQWHHIAYTYNGTNMLPANTKFYIDGKQMTMGGGSSSTLSFPSSTEDIFIGRFNSPTSANWWNGQISNFKLYNVALEPSEVKKLYNLGRTGRSMVISDTAVGIGKVPEAQLDVRGNLAVSGNFNGNSSIKFFRFPYQMPNNTDTQYLRRSGASTNGVDYSSYFTPDFDDQRILSITSVVYNTNGDAVMGQGGDTNWLHSIYSIPASAGANAGLVIYFFGSSCVSKRIEMVVITY